MDELIQSIGDLILRVKNKVELSAMMSHSDFLLTNKVNESKLRAIMSNFKEVSYNENTLELTVYAALLK